MAVERSCKAYRTKLDEVKDDLADLKLRIETYAKTGDRDLERDISIFGKALEIRVEDEWKKIDPYRVELRRNLMKEFRLGQLPDAFKRGWAKVGSYFFIDREGKRLALDREDIFIMDDFSEGVAVGEDATGGQCFITDEGKTIFELRNPETSRMSLFQTVDPPSDGVSKVKFRGEDSYQFVRIDEMRVIEPVALGVARIQQAREFHEGKASVQLTDGRWRYIDKDGVYSSNFYEIYASDYSEGVAWVQMNPLRGSENAFRLVDANGKIISSTYYKGGWKCSEGLIAAESSDGVWQFIDRYGNLAIDDLFEDVHFEGFQEGKCAVQKAGSWVFIGIDGKELFGGERFDGIISGFKNGRAAVQQGSDYFFIDDHGRKVLGPYNAISHSFIDGIAQVVTDTDAPSIDWYGRDVYRED